MWALQWIQMNTTHLYQAIFYNLLLINYDSAYFIFIL